MSDYHRHLSSGDIPTQNAYTDPYTESSFLLCLWCLQLTVELFVPRELVNPVFEVEVSK